MTVRELIEYLEDCNQEAIVKIAYQPNYPMCEETNTFAEVGDVVYIGGENHNDYLSGEASKELGWH